MCIRWLINWSDSTKMHGATIRLECLFLNHFLVFGIWAFGETSCVPTDHWKENFYLVLGSVCRGTLWGIVMWGRLMRSRLFKEFVIMCKSHYLALSSLLVTDCRPVLEPWVVVVTLVTTDSYRKLRREQSCYVWVNFCHIRRNSEIQILLQGEV